MAKRRDTSRAGWARKGGAENAARRTEIARADGRSSDSRVTGTDIRRMGPYETSYQIDFGYSSGRETL